MMVMIIAIMFYGLFAETGYAHEENIVGFWNIYAEGPYFRDIIEEQKRVIDTSGLMDRIDMLYFTTMGNRGDGLQFQTGHDPSKVRHLKYFGNNGSEILTLNLLYQYCHLHPLSKVFYFHNKGSLNYNIQNIHFRRALDCFVLNPSCADALDEFDTCGWRVSPLPHVHYSGNYWWARCSHINSLIPPLAPLYNQTFLELSAKLYRRRKDQFGRAFSVLQPTKEDPFPDQPYLGLGRYFAETWVGSKPMFKPADCMNASENNRYMWGKFPLPWRKVNKYCSNFKEGFMATSIETTPVTTRVAEAVRGPRPGTLSLPSGADNSAALPRVGGPEKPSHLEMNSVRYKRLSYGLGPCQLAGMIMQPKLMQKRFKLSIDNFTEELYDRSFYWYGEQPHLHLQWLSLYT